MAAAAALGAAGLLAAVLDLAGRGLALAPAAFAAETLAGAACAGACLTAGFAALAAALRGRPASTGSAAAFERLAAPRGALGAFGLLESPFAMSFPPVFAAFVQRLEPETRRIPIPECRAPFGFDKDASTLSSPRVVLVSKFARSPDIGSCEFRDHDTGTKSVHFLPDPY
ncbi:hypothetical protein [Phreatobacter sp. AB_2022a]|uniref:hypothetical protein n=1 Tax=Phreatobacter sp. AB_2022a TaxID=3003134 RepID=UPI002286F9F2|nr:hypothetical protein [Phreatobacter sp. AB_2022a]MCZ0733435.1 hypothetical protein [Phreatobacter sp. AB_2022a]